MLDLIHHKDGRVTLPSNADPAAAGTQVNGWLKHHVGMDLGRNDPSAIVVVRDECYLPVPGNDAHAGIYDVMPADLEAITEGELRLLELLAGQAWSRFLTRDMADALPLAGCGKSPDVA